MKTVQIKKIKKLIDHHSVISFDVFDTLISRYTKRPSDIFWLLDIVCKNRFDIDGFQEERVKAKERAKAKNRYYRLEDVYAEMPYTLEAKEHLMELELEFELKLSHRNSTICDLFEYAKSNQKRIFLVSDMYLGVKTITIILKKCGIIGYEKLYVSCDAKAEKIAGDLFKKVYSENSIKPHDILHIGDGIKNDIIRGKLCGLHTVHVNCPTYTYYKDTAGLNNVDRKIYELLRGVISYHRAENVHSSSEFELGYEVLGTTIYGFTVWLKEQLQKLDIKKIYFLAREGSLLKRAFEEICDVSDNIESHYLYVSRKSLTVPNFALMGDYDSLVKMMVLPKKITIKEFLNRLGLSPEEHCTLLEKRGFSLLDEVSGWNLEGNEVLRKVYSILKEQIYENAKIQYYNIKKYLKEENFTGKVAIVDVGWNGTMQKALSKLVKSWDESSTEIHGFYFGINEQKDETLNYSLCHGYLYESGCNTEYQYYIMGMSGPLELMMTANHGTTVKYTQNDDTVKCVLAKSEYFEQPGSREAKLIHDVQNGAMQFVEDASNIGLHKIIIPSGKCAFQNFFLFGKNPIENHKALFMGLKEYDGGVEEILLTSNTYNHIFGKESIMRGFWKSSWKIAYMKDKFRLPLPYEKIYMYMRKRRK